MPRRLILTAICLYLAPLAAGQAPPKPLVTGLKNPTAVTVGGDGRIYVTVAGEPGKKGDGGVQVIDNDRAIPFAGGLDQPWCITSYQKWLLVTDGRRVLRIDDHGKVSVITTESSGPSAPKMFLGITADPESGTIYVGVQHEDRSRAIGRINAQGKLDEFIDDKQFPRLFNPTSLLLDGASHLLVGSLTSTGLFRIKLNDASVEKITDELRLISGMSWDDHGRLLVGSTPLFFLDSQLSVISRPGESPVSVLTTSKMAFTRWDPVRKRINVLDPVAGTLTAIPLTIPGHEVDETPLPLQTALAFPDLKWEGWKGATDDGKVHELRTIMLTHAGDGSNRVFVGEQHGVIYVFPNDPKATEAKVFLDLRDRVAYNDNMNEEGFLGVTFHPKFKDNGEFFVYYTTKKAKLTNILSRFRVRKDDPNRADPDSEEELMRFEKPFWNHDGGTVCFGPDGYLYTTHGDGGAGGDPYDNGQNLKSLLGKVHRIDVDHKGPGKNYAIPKDNPFADRTDARPEIWAYGLRNIWRMAFDRKTGRLWAADVGQNLYEEIDLIERGGNYGWNRREGLHPFGAKGTGPRKEFIEPIWEYHHDLGKSIIGGAVYRGARLPELDGFYVYGDYVSGKIWALRYEEAKARVVANRPIKDRNIPVFSFGEDEKGEIYLLTATKSGQGIYQFVK
jgi:glucose/arabinose dehydrogenase